MPRKMKDRRVRRTRALLQDALLQLMVQKGYEATTVQDIIDRADVGRATFYAHFADKRTLLASRLEDLRDSLMAQQRQPALQSDGTRHLSFSRPLLEHAAGGLPLWRALAGAESGAFVLQRIHDMLTDLVRNDVLAWGIQLSPQHREMVVQYLTGAFMSVMTWWLDQGAELSVEEVDQVFQQLSVGSLTSQLGPRRKEPDATERSCPGTSTS
jgi:AcrR family transcriptional regulator